MKHYTLKLTAVTPFHVGSGVKYSKKEYYVDTKTQTVTLMDMNRVMGWIAEQGREALIGAFESFMMSRNDNDIRDFLTRRIRMPETVQKDCVLYSFRCGGAFSSDTNKRDLSAFMRDAEGRPYVPGSSLKGALRTVLLVKMLRDGKLHHHNADIRNLKNAAEIAEKSLLHKLNKMPRQDDMLNSIMSGFSVSDSPPFGNDQITLASKIDVSTDGAEHELPLMRECARPGTELCFSLTISEEAERFAGVSYLKEAIDEFGGYYSECYLSKYQKKFAENLDCCIFLGGGSGYYAKNIIYPMSAGDRRKALEAVASFMKGKFKVHRHDKDIRLGVSPHMLKCTRVDGSLRQLGLCRVEIEERK